MSLERKIRIVQYVTKMAKIVGKRLIFKILLLIFIDIQTAHHKAKNPRTRLPILMYGNTASLTYLRNICYKGVITRWAFIRRHFL